MSENKSRRVGVINFVGKIDIPAEAVTVAVKSNIAIVGRHLLIDLKGIRDLPIPPAALIAVEIKDNVLNEPNNHAFKTWGEIDRSFTLRVGVDGNFYARRTSIRVLFVDPATGGIIASSPLLHASDDTGELQNSGESYIKFRRDATQTMPSKAIVEIEGPVIEFGAFGPADVAESESDLGFVKYGLPGNVGDFVSALILAEEGYDTPRWSKFKADAADWAGFDDWKSIRKEFEKADKPEITAAKLTNKVVSGLMNSRAYKDKLKRLIAQSETAKTEIQAEELQNVA
jgi:hypothetical protein